mgnify:CR=1 FL=1
MDDRGADDLFMSVVLYHNQSLKSFFRLFVLIVIVAVTNPLFVQRGRTILYADTHVRITKRSIALWNSLRMCISKSLTVFSNLLTNI